MGKELEIKELFQIGDLHISHGVLEAAKGDMHDIVELIERHQVGDWGDIENHDKNINIKNLTIQKPILSCYRYNGNKIYIVTEIARNVTWVALTYDFINKGQNNESGRFTFGGTKKSN